MNLSWKHLLIAAAFAVGVGVMYEAKAEDKQQAYVYRVLICDQPVAVTFVFPDRGVFVFERGADIREMWSTVAALIPNYDITERDYEATPAIGMLCV